ncbi:MAG: 50S ribosomal protein L3 [Planctomycetota bacterium]
MREERSNPAGVSQAKRARRALLGKKLGMTQLYLESGELVPVTVLKAGPCTVLEVKTPERDGYAAVQLGFEETKKAKKRPQQARLEGLGLRPLRFVREVRFVDPNDARPRAAEAPASGEPASAEAGQLAPGSVVGVWTFRGVARVDVRGRTKGRGFAGVIRRHHFNAGPKSHGTKNIREPGSTGMHTDPARVLPGKKMPGHLGAAYRKARNLQVIRVDEEENLLVVRGAVPGPNGGYVTIEESLE